MALSKEDENFIHRHPLDISDDILDALTENSNITRSLPPAHEGLLTRRDAISNLVATLQISSVARRLTHSLRPINAQLATINAKLQSDTFDLSSFATLAKLVPNRANDIEIWHAVLQLIADLARVTPPLSSIRPSFSGTPLRRSSASFRDSNQKREELRKHVLTELSGRTYEDVPEFVTKYFEKKAWSEQVDKILEELPVGDPLREFPDTSKPVADLWWRIWRRGTTRLNPRSIYRSDDHGQKNIGTISFIWPE